MAIPPYRFVEASLSHLEMLVPLFDGYRMFYEQASDVEAARNFLRERLTAKDTVVLLAVNRAEQGCGFVHLFPIFTSVGMQRLWLLNDLFVSPDHRREGLARELMRKAQAYAERTGAKGLFLQTAKTNVSAQRLYEEEGFIREEESYWYEWVVKA
jgi:ribosomal protein S18 acetylase RimI-like enzyme